MSDARTRFIEIHLTSSSVAAGKIVAELGMPHGVVLISVRRGRELLIPHGDTQLQSDDLVTVLCGREHIERVRAILGAVE